RDFAERYAEPMNYHVENRIMELGIPTDRIGARKYGYPHRAFWPEETTGGGNAPGRRLTVDSGVFNAELMANRPEAGRSGQNRGSAIGSTPSSPMRTPRA